MKESLLMELYILRKRTMVKILQVYWEKYPSLKKNKKTSEHY